MKNIVLLISFALSSCKCLGSELLFPMEGNNFFSNNRRLDLKEFTIGGVIKMGFKNPEILRKIIRKNIKELIKQSTHKHLEAAIWTYLMVQTSSKIENEILNENLLSTSLKFDDKLWHEVEERIVENSWRLFKHALIDSFQDFGDKKCSLYIISQYFYVKELLKEPKNYDHRDGDYVQTNYQMLLKRFAGQFNEGMITLKEIENFLGDNDCEEHNDLTNAIRNITHF